MAWADMEPKQKGMLIATIVIFGVICYMVYKMFFAGSGAVITHPKEVKQATAENSVPQTQNNATPGSELAINSNMNGNETTPGSISNTANSNMPTTPQVVEIPKRELTAEELALLDERRQVQQQYLQLVNQYQLT